MRRDEVLLRDILSEIAFILATTQNRTEDDFRADLVLNKAVLHSLTVIGEAANKVSDELKSTHPSIPWRRISGLRNQIVHNYPGIDLELIWQVVTRELPKLRSLISALQ